MKIFYFIFHTPFFIAFWLTMILFHPIFVITHALNRKVFEKCIVLLNKVHIFNARYFAGLSLSVENKVSEIKERDSLIIIANHQNIYDIAFLTTLFPQKVLYFVAKKQLGKWIPTVSFLLRNANGILIDRKSGKEALKVLADFTPRLEQEHLQVVIFPEGTRAKDGVLKPFKMSGLRSLIAASPSTKIVTAIIDGNWKLLNPKMWRPFKKVNVRVTLEEEHQNSEESTTDFLTRIEKKFKEQVQ